jgi:gluconate 2-dehydrogenase subunit 3-like protein
MTDAPNKDALSRRDMLAATAAALATPLVNVGAARAAAAAARPSEPPPRFLTTAELALLDELTELIIPADDHSPGARAARVAGYIDGRLAESLEPDWQALWRSGLAAVDVLSRELNGKPFLDATPDQRVTVLTRMAAGESDPKTAPERFFGELKRWTVRGYYTSKIGIQLDQEYKGNVYQRGEFAGYDVK